MLLCPVCHNPLDREAAGYRCAKGHAYDMARSGYVNLLLPGDKHARVPGDNKLMVDARCRFLEKGYYAFLLDEVCAVARRFLQGRRAPALLDVGCGEGYYTLGLARCLHKPGTELHLTGIDISKIALDKAGKRFRAVENTLPPPELAVASAFHLPLPDASCDLLTNLFAPYCGDENWRVLRRGGGMLLVIPGENHLWELKEAVYDTPYKNEVKAFELDGFRLLEHRQVSKCLTICGEDVGTLFRMTPYYYKTSRQGQERVEILSKLEIQVVFELLCYEKI